MKYYYGNSCKEALNNNPVEIESAEILEAYKENYSCVFPAEEDEGKKYFKVELYVGTCSIGTYYVEACDAETAREMAWDLAECDFYADECEISKEEYEEEK